MTTPDSLSIVPRPSAAIVKRSAGAENILARMTSDILDLAQAHATAIKEARFKIGAYELREADYQQILLWAQALALPPLTVITHLANSVCESFGGDPPASRILFALDDGAITSLAWDFEKLPLKIFQWVTGLRVEQLGFMGTPATSPALALHLPFLSVLCCGSTQLTELDLSNVPALTKLNCWMNQLTELDLSNVPDLTELYCSSNQLTELDLSNVPDLREFDCSHNQLTTLDIRKLSNLESFRHDLRVITRKRKDQNF